MGIFKQFKDMATMVNAAPGLIDQAQQLQAQAQVYQQGVDMQAMNAQAMHALTAEPQPGNLEPIAGVDLTTYARIVKGISAYGYDQSKLTYVAATFGVAAPAWEQAEAGWAARIQADCGVGRRFNEIYQAV